MKNEKKQNNDEDNIFALVFNIPKLKTKYEIWQNLRPVKILKTAF